MTAECARCDRLFDVDELLPMLTPCEADPSHFHHGEPMCKPCVLRLLDETPPADRERMMAFAVLDMFERREDNDPKLAAEADECLRECGLLAPDTIPLQEGKNRHG